MIVYFNIPVPIHLLPLSVYLALFVTFHLLHVRHEEDVVYLLALVARRSLPSAEGLMNVSSFRRSGT